MERRATLADGIVTAVLADYRDIALYHNDGWVVDKQAIVGRFNCSYGTARDVAARVKVQLDKRRMLESRRKQSENLSTSPPEHLNPETNNLPNVQRTTGT